MRISVRFEVRYLLAFDFIFAPQGITIDQSLLL